MNGTESFFSVFYSYLQSHWNQSIFVHMITCTEKDLKRISVVIYPLRGTQLKQQNTQCIKLTLHVFLFEFFFDGVKYEVYGENCIHLWIKIVNREIKYRIKYL